MEISAPDLVIVACGQAKSRHARPAHDLYTGGYFQACRDYAYTLLPTAAWRKIRILSARFGLVSLTTWLEPYNVRLGQPGSIDREQLLVQAIELELNHARRVVVLGGRDYVTLARRVWPHAEAPLEGRGGIGRQIQWLRSETAQRRAK